MNYVIYLLAFILLLGAAVVIHEFGHFIVAKLLRIRVETFSVGFGPRLFGKKWGTTDYRVSAIPLGGYVKLGGDESNAAIEGEGASDIPPEEQFSLRPRYQRILVAVAGPVMNVLTALSVPLIGGLLYGIPATPTPAVVSVKPNGAAQVAGLRPGDRIVSFNENDSPTWERIRGDALLSPNQPLPLTVERDGHQLKLTITPSPHKEGSETVGDLDFLPDYGQFPIYVREIEEGSPVANAGLKPGDKLISINNEPARNSEQVRQYIRDHSDKPITLTVERNGAQQNITATVAKLARGNVGLGLVPVDDMPLQRASLWAASAHAVSFNVEIMRLTGKAIAQIFKGQRSARDTLSGPIGIARATSMAVDEGGWGGFFSMFGFLSLNLGIFNLLPVPVLDGGAIFLMLLEAALGLVGLTLSMTMRERIQQVGFAMLLLLMVFVITNDLIKEYSIRFGAESNQPAATQQK